MIHSSLIDIFFIVNIFLDATLFLPYYRDNLIQSLGFTPFYGGGSGGTEIFMVYDRHGTVGRIVINNDFLFW